MTSHDSAGDDRRTPPASELGLAEVERRRAEVAASLAALERERSATVQANSYARARERAGVGDEGAEARSRLESDEADAHDAMKAARMELHRLDAEIESRPREKRFGAALRRLRRGEH